MFQFIPFKKVQGWSSRVEFGICSKAVNNATVQVEMEQASSSIVTSTFIVSLEPETTRSSAMQYVYIEPCLTNRDMWKVFQGDGDYGSTYE